jgi:integrase
MTKRAHQTGGLQKFGPDKFRIRYRVGSKRHSEMFSGNQQQAEARLRVLLGAADKGEHVAPDRQTVKGWIEHWLKIGAPGRRRNEVSGRTLERYSQLLHTHILTEKVGLGECRLQKLTASQISERYAAIGGSISPRTLRHVHVVFSAALSAAVRAGILSTSPMERLLKKPKADEADHGIALDEAQLKKLVEGFRGSALFLIVAVAAYTGMRRNEILALRWCDVDIPEKILHVRRAIEQLKGKGNNRFKAPKTARGIRDVVIDDGLAHMLRAEREKFLRLKAGITEDGPPVDLSLLKMPKDALIFPSFAGPRSDFSRPRDPRAVTRGFTKLAAKLGHPDLRFHDLRGSHGTQLLRRGVSVDVVARRLGHDPYTLLKSYAKATETDNERIAKELAGMSAL